jgi:tryptophanyl-tRNA synthetase
MKAISGIRPTGKLHLGNYIGSIQPALKHDADVLIAEFHAPHGNVAQLAGELLHYFKPDKIKFQSEQFDARLYFELLDVTPTGLLLHMPQYKEKEKTALMLTYPVLMAHDIAEYELVIVGDDQRPHIELAEDILYRVGYECPTVIYDGGRIMDLRHPIKKMSKSNPNSCVFLSDDAATVEHKVRKAVTTPEGLVNLKHIYHALSGEVAAFATNAELKDALIDVINNKVTYHTGD